MFLALFRAPNPVMRGHSQRVLALMVFYIPLWIAGAAADPGPRLWWWGAAALIDMIGTWLGRSGRALGRQRACHQSPSRVRLGPGGAAAFWGPILYLAGQAWYYRATTQHAWGQRLIDALRAG